MKYLSRLMLILAVLLPSVAEAVYPTPNHRWKCQDDAATTAVVDEIAADNLTMFGGNTDAVSVDDGPGGIITKSFLFNGTSTYASQSGSITAGGLTGLTVVCWMKSTTATDQDFLVTEWSAIDDKKAFGIEPFDTSGKFRVFVGAGTTVYAMLSTTNHTVLSDGEWHHVGFTYDGPTQTVLVYIDGVEEAVTGDTPPTALATSSGDRITNFGALQNGSRFPGNVADVVVWENDVLTEAEIQEVMSEGGGGGGGGGASPRALHLFRMQRAFHRPNQKRLFVTKTCFPYLTIRSSNYGPRL